MNASDLRHDRQAARILRRTGSATRSGAMSRGTSPLLAESLEPRQLMTFSWSAEEVYLLELVNRARANPMAEGALLGLDLTKDLTDAEIAKLVPQEPLALNEALTVAARLHSQDMADNDYFSHIDLQGNSPSDRATAQGYVYSAGENIAAGYESIDIVHRAWLDSVDHRKNVLSLYEDFDEFFHYDEFGAGLYIPGAGTRFSSYDTQMFGYQGISDVQTYVLGVVYADNDANQFYTIGEGAGGVQIDVLDAGSAVVGTYTTDAAGNYQIAVQPGTYTVRFTILATNYTLDQSVIVDTTNVKLDALTDTFNPPADSGGGGGGGDTGGGGGGGGDTGGGGGGGGGGDTGGGGGGGGGDTTSRNLTGPAGTVNGSVSSSSGSEQLTFVTRAPDNTAIAFKEGASNTWTFEDLHSMTGSPALTGNLISWVDPTDDLTYAAAPSASGLLLFVRNANGSWAFGNLTSSVYGSAIITSEITAFTDLNNVVHVAGLKSGGDLVMFTRDGNSTANGRSWTYSNIAQDHLRAQSLAMPALVGPIISYVTDWNGLNIAGLDSSGNIQSIWWAPGMDLWRTDNLSAITGASPIAGGLTCYLTSWGGINLAGVDASGDVTVSWWVPSFAGNWVNTNLTNDFGGPSMVGVSISSYVTPWGGLNIAGRDTNGKLSVYWWAPGLDAWQTANLTDVIGTALLPTGAIRGVTTPNGRIVLLGANDDGHVLRYWWSPDASWQAEDVTLAS
ncbi:MAG: CAP domain-containing protein [Phycisphaerales bacterium]